MINRKLAWESHRISEIEYSDAAYIPLIYIISFQRANVVQASRRNVPSSTWTVDVLTDYGYMSNGRNLPEQLGASPAIGSSPKLLEKGFHARDILYAT